MPRGIPKEPRIRKPTDDSLATLSPAGKSREQLKADELAVRLRQIAPLAVQIIEDSLRAEKGKPSHSQAQIDSAWRVIEHVKGRPAQDYGFSQAGGGPLLIRVVEWPEPPPRIQPEVELEGLHR